MLKTHHSYLMYYLTPAEVIGVSRCSGPTSPLWWPGHLNSTELWSVQLTFPAPLWSHNVLWCLMSSFSIHFHPLQEASYNADRIRHTTAEGQREEHSKTEKKNPKNEQTKKHWIVMHNYLLFHHMSKYTFDPSRFEMIMSTVLMWSDDGYADWTSDF